MSDFKERMDEIFTGTVVNINNVENKQGVQYENN